MSEGKSSRDDAIFLRREIIDAIKGQMKADEKMDT